MASSSEHPLVRKARMAVGKVVSLEYTLHCVKAQVEAARIEATRAVHQMGQSGEPDEPWARHYRECMGE